MVDLTAGQVSSIINAGLTILEFSLPLALAFILVGFINNRSQAITWSVVSNLLHNTLWPTILSSDSVSKKVHGSVYIIARIASLNVVIWNIARILTPLGVSDKMAETQSRSPTFGWAVDDSSFSMATADRSPYGMTRVCGSGDGMCPGQEGNTTTVEEGAFALAPWGMEAETVSWGAITHSQVYTETWDMSASSTSSSDIGTTSAGTRQISSTSTLGTTNPGTGQVSSTSLIGTTNVGTGQVPSTSVVETTNAGTEQIPGTSATGTTNVGTRQIPATSATGILNTGTGQVPATSATGTTNPGIGQVPSTSVAGATNVGTGQVPSTSAVGTTIVQVPSTSATGTTNAGIVPVPSTSATGTTNLVIGTTNVGTGQISSSGLPTSTRSVIVLTITSTLPVIDKRATQDVIPATSEATPHPPFPAASSRGNTNNIHGLPPQHPSHVTLNRRSNSTRTRTRRIGSGIPSNLASLFSKASFYGTSVANLFEIQFRNYLLLSSSEHRLASGHLYTIGQFRFLETLILKKGYEVVKGLVVDAKHGGVGFRSHAIPDKVRYGAIWSEVLLWMEPETRCVENKVSLQVTTTDEGEPLMELIDQGGLVEALKENPPVLGQGERLDLFERARNGAFYLNMEIAEALNITLGGTGREYNITGDTRNLAAIYKIATDLGSNQFAVHRHPLNSPADEEGNQEATLIDTHCVGYTAHSPASVPSMQCGLIVGAGRRTDTRSTTLSGTYHYPLYTCATAIRASLQTAGFTANGTSLSLPLLNLESLTLVPNPPLWGVEKTSLLIHQIRPLWGLILPSDEHSPDLTANRSQYLYLPAGQNTSIIPDSLAGVGSYLFAQQLAFDSTPLTPDYSGAIDFALYKRWEKLSETAEDVALISGLIWTDIMANAVTSVVAGGEAGLLKYRVYKRKLLFDYLYAIPVFLLVLLWMLLHVCAVTFWLTGRVSVGVMKQLLNQTSTGRVVCNILSPGNDSAQKSKLWAAEAGKQVIGLRNGIAGDGEGPTGVKVVGTQVIGLQGGTGEIAEADQGGMPRGEAGCGFTDSPAEERVAVVLKRWP